MNTTVTPASPSFSIIVRTFAPGWPAALMGTGAFALATLRFSSDIPALAWMAGALHYFNLALFVLIAPLWIARWFIAREAALATLKHPVAASFYPTFAVALLVLAGQLRAFGGHEELALLVWWAGTVLTYLFAYAVLFAIFQGEQMTLDHVTPGIFIPPVALVVIPVAGAPLVAAQPEVLRELALVLNGIGLGAGALMYFALLALAFHRFYLHRPLPAMMAPTVWINLAPLGVMVVSVLNLVAVMPFAGDKSPYVMAVFMLWGFGAFWLVIALMLTWAARRSAPLPFSLTWWAFTFPLAAFTLGSQRLADVTGMSIPLGFAWLAWALLAFLWTATLIKTVGGVRSGAVFRPQG